MAAHRAGGGIVKVPAGAYWIAVDYTGAALTVPPGVYLDLSGVELHLIENDLPIYNIVLFKAGPAGIRGGTIVGDRERHLGKTGEWGHCITLLGASDVTIQGTKAFKCWGDGIMIGYPVGGQSPSKRVVIEGVEAAYNRRNNISVVAADGFRISDAYLHHAGGTPPEAGLDLEPENEGGVRNGELVNIRVERNGHAGMVFGGSSGVLDQVTLSSAVAADNKGPGFWIQYVGNVRADRLKAEGNGEEGLRVLRSPNLSITSYRGSGNGKADTIPPNVIRGQ